MAIVLPNRNRMYQALVEKDPSFEGIFVAAIRTTGIFCRPTCHARKPKPENVEYFCNARAAIAAGFRACKLCRPMESLGHTPAWIAELIQEVESAPSIKLTAQNLRERGLEPARVRRWFQKHHGMTFHAYQKMRRINQAFGQIRQGSSVVTAALESGYDSLSGFTEGFKQTTGFTPMQSDQNAIISITRVSTPLGPMLAGVFEDKLCLLEFTDRRMLETQLERLRKRFKAEILPGEDSLFEELNQQLDEYFQGNRIEFDIPLDIRGTPFQEKVWKVLLTIPPGKTRSYKQQAEMIGQPTAVRAVARANGDNRIAILIPCHRVIGADGKLTGYGGGLWRKERLLELEGGQIKSGRLF